MNSLFSTLPDAGAHAHSANECGVPLFMVSNCEYSRRSRLSELLDARVPERALLD
jgi:hypothetical protein